MSDTSHAAWGRELLRQAAVAFGLPPEPVTQFFRECDLPANATDSEVALPNPLGPIETLGRLYEARLARSRPGRRKQGQYYTPPLLIDRLLDFALEDAPTTLFDPAVGCGFFLLAAMRRREGKPCGLYGMDLDPVAVGFCRTLLWLESQGRIEPERLMTQIRVGDSLRETQGSYDAIVGNPPFANAIQHHAPAVRPLYPRLGGTADLAFYFLDLATRHVRPGGRIALVQPRALLTAPSAERLRAELIDPLAPLLLECPSGSKLFEGADVYVCLVGLGPGDASWPRPRPVVAHMLGELYEVSASLTVEEAYALRPFLVDEAEGAAPKLLTTGLIEPGHSLWGQRGCRYLRTTYRFPRVCESSPLPTMLRRRIDKSKRPKLLVAGLSARIECLEDLTGEYLGAVSTYSIYDPQDSPQRLLRLKEILHSHEATQVFRDTLGPAAMGGGNITMSKRFLKEFPLPKEWGGAGDRN